jgi:aspartyl-tRNA(Asn)/glutamyl-tRNA(Gln) amidotransferase subunit A
MSFILDLTATELLGHLERGELAAVEICEAYLDQFDRIDSNLRAFLRVDRGGAMQDAETVDHRRELGMPVGRLAGLPIAVKDIICTRGQPTTCGSRMLEDFISPYHATVIEKVQAADMVFLGKTNLDEFAMGSSTENSAFGSTRNPWDVTRVPGGSSGGSAAAVAARMVPWSLGTDTGGSIRQPASFCGIAGLKPTYGRVSRYGLIAFASSLDQIGPLARTVDDLALLLEVIAGHDPKDSTSARIDVPQYAAAVSQPLPSLRLGIAREHFGDGLHTEVSAAVLAAIDVYRDLGAEIVDVELPHSRFGIATYYIIAPCEASSNLARYDGVHYGYRSRRSSPAGEVQQELLSAGDDPAAVDSALVRMYRHSRSEGFGPEVKRRIMLGTYALSAGYYDAYYAKALKVRRRIRDDFDSVFREVDFLLGPVTPTPAFRLGERIDDPLAMYLEDLYTVTANLAGIPAVSIPCGFSQDGLPIGLQLQARPFDEQRLLQAAAMFQRVTDWHLRKPAFASTGSGDSP